MDLSIQQVTNGNTTSIQASSVKPPESISEHDVTHNVSTDVTSCQECNVKEQLITELTNERDALELQVEKLQLQLDRPQRQNNDLGKELTTAVETPKVQERHNQAPRLGPGFPLLQKLPETEAGSLCPSSSSPADRKVAFSRTGCQWNHPTYPGRKNAGKNEVKTW